jgi:tRNA-dihydrouridine synthase 2
VDPTDGNIIFRTCAEEKEKVVLQMGTSDVNRALTVGKKVQNDVAAIDINMGCPKSFSIKGGMGVALLYNIENATKILKTLVENLDIQVTCKIRIKPDLEETIKTAKALEATGISAIAVHGRTRDERPGDPCHPDVIRQIAEAVKIPVIANGGSKDIEKYSDIDKFRKACGVSSVMIARAAQWNVSIFRKDGPLQMDDLIKEYLKLAIEFDNSATNTKYCVQMILRDQQETPRGKRFLETQTLEQIW